MRVSSVLEVGDVVYSAANGLPMKVTGMYSCGFETEEDYYSFDELGKLLFLHPKSFFFKKEGKINNER